MQPHTFSSFDEYLASLGHANLRLTALARNRKPWAMGHWALDGLRVRWARDGGPCLFEGAVDVDGVGLVACINATGKVSGNGVLFGSQSVMVIPGHKEIQSVSHDAVSWISVFIPACRLSLPSGHGTPTPCGVVESPRIACTKFRELLGRVVTEAMAGSFEGNPLGQTKAARSLVSSAIELLSPAPLCDEFEHHLGRNSISRQEIFRRVERLLESRRNDSLSLQDLSLAAGVSDRTLHNAFHERFGLSPKRFLRLRALNVARQKLRRGGPSVARVSDVAAKLGIWEWGRFSRDYRELFGELPSQTLHR